VDSRWLSRWAYLNFYLKMWDHTLFLLLQFNCLFYILWLGYLWWIQSRWPQQCITPKTHSKCLDVKQKHSIWYKIIMSLKQTLYWSSERYPEIRNNNNPCQNHSQLELLGFWTPCMTDWLFLVGFTDHQSLLISVHILNKTEVDYKHLSLWNIVLLDLVIPLLFWKYPGFYGTSRYVSVLRAPYTLS